MKTNGHSNLDSTLRTPRVQHGNDTLFKIELALSRLENGDYGYCVRCQSPIAIEQLEEDPSAVICDSCRKTRT